MVRGLKILLKIAVTCGALWFLFRNYEVTRILTLVERANGTLLALAAALTIGQFLMTTWRWQLVHRALTGVLLPMRIVVVAFGRGLLFGQLLPPVVGTDAIRVGTIAGHGGLRASVRSVAIDRILGLLSLVVIVVATLPLLAAWVNNAPVTGTLFAVSVGGLVSFLAFLAWPRAFHWMPVLGDFMVQVANDARLILRSRFGAWSLTLAFSSHILSAFMFLLLVRSVDSHAPISMCLLVIFPAMLASSVPISLSGWGVREVTIASAFSLAGADPIAGATASILFGLTNPLAGAFGEACGLLLPPKTAPMPPPRTSDKAAPQT